MYQKINIFWMRRDMRLHDLAALYAAQRDNLPILFLFILDSEILDELKETDKRVSFIYDTLLELNKNLSNYGSSIAVVYGKPTEVFRRLFDNRKIHKIYAGIDYEPYAKRRDQEIYKIASDNDAELILVKEHVLMHKTDVIKSDNQPYKVYTPYMRKWKEVARARSHSNEIFQSSIFKSYDIDYSRIQFVSHNMELKPLDTYGFKHVTYNVYIKDFNVEQLYHYDKDRDYPYLDSTSKLSTHLRFGTISIRELAKSAGNINEIFLNQLIWRDFYSMILDFYPKVVDTEFYEKYRRIKWRNNEEEFEAWKEGRTGYALVDAGMRQLNETGFMHNRLRMITAGFLTKHLLIDWRWGEAYFAEKLLDYDLASNNGGWQWAAGTGTDAAPYFRIFNPITQIKKIDKDKKYIKKWIPEYSETDYLDYIVDHKYARERALRVYKEAINDN